MEDNRNFNDFDTVDLDEERQALAIIDQTLLPSEMKMLYLTDQQDIWDAIYLLKVRGAPAIGVAAGIAIYLAAKDIHAVDFEDFYAQFVKAKDYLNSSRPTAVNLSWALKRQEQTVLDNKDKPLDEIVKILHDEALKIRDEDIADRKSVV